LKVIYNWRNTGYSVHVSSLRAQCSGNICPLSLSLQVSFQSQLLHLHLHDSVSQLHLPSPRCYERALWPTVIISHNEHLFNKRLTCSLTCKPHLFLIVAIALALLTYEGTLQCLTRSRLLPIFPDITCDTLIVIFIRSSRPRLVMVEPRSQRRTISWIPPSPLPVWPFAIASSAH
jgi:hypothetical protein